MYLPKVLKAFKQRETWLRQHQFFDLVLFFFFLPPGVQCEYRNGLPVLLVPLPSRRERCQFTLKPVTETVGDFINHVKSEDGGVDRAGIYNEGTHRVLMTFYLLESRSSLPRKHQRQDVESPFLHS